MKSRRRTILASILLVTAAVLFVTVRRFQYTMRRMHDGSIVAQLHLEISEFIDVHAAEVEARLGPIAPTERVLTDDEFAWLFNELVKSGADVAEVRSDRRSGGRILDADGHTFRVGLRKGREGDLLVRLFSVGPDGVAGTPDDHGREWDDPATTRSATTIPSPASAE